METRWLYVTSENFPALRTASKDTCIIPMGCVEKHGLHGPLGTDILQASAIAYMASLIDTLYQIKVPAPGTTYNVGTISGGTSVNTIAQHAEMLYEYRSKDRTALEEMKKHFEAAIEFYRTKGIEVRVTQKGDRPCSGDVDEGRHQILKDRAAAAVKKYFDRDVPLVSGSTDCNIPLSMGIPAICVGCVLGFGAHTREEYVEIDSLFPGYHIAFEMILHHF